MSFSLEVARSTALHDLRDMGIDLPGGGMTTVGALVDDWLGRRAAVGETACISRWQITIVAGHESRIPRYRIEHAPLAVA
jgi:CBS domain containing-hemolysin-like protein